MALFGSLAVVRGQCARFPEFQVALAYAEHAVAPGSDVRARIAGLTGGSVHRQELAGGAYAMEMAYRTKPRAEGFFETHRKFVDVQVVVTGEELMEVAGAARLGVKQAYDEAKDMTKYADTEDASVLRVQAGDVAIFWPEDAHMPGLEVRNRGLVRKTVIKVPVPA